MRTPAWVGMMPTSTVAPDVGAPSATALATSSSVTCRMLSATASQSYRWHASRTNWRTIIACSVSAGTEIRLVSGTIGHLSYAPDACSRRLSSPSHAWSSSADADVQGHPGSWSGLPDKARIKFSALSGRVFHEVGRAPELGQVPQPGKERFMANLDDQRNGNRPVVLFDIDGTLVD